MTDVQQARPSVLSALLVRDLRIGRRIGGAVSMGVVFFLCLVTVTPFAVGPIRRCWHGSAPPFFGSRRCLRRCSASTASFKPMPKTARSIFFLTSETPLELIVLVKCLAHWLLTGLPLVAASPIFGLMLGLGPDGLVRVAFSLLAGTPALTLLGAIGAALTVSLRRGGLLLAVLILPLSVPVLIFGVAAAGDPVVGFKTPFLILCGLTLASVALTPVCRRRGTTTRRRLRGVTLAG